MNNDNDQQNLLDFEFILQEILQLHQQNEQTDSQEHYFPQFDEHICLKVESENFKPIQLLCGREAKARFKDISIRYLKLHDKTGSFEASSFVEAFTAEFHQRFLIEQRKAETLEVDEALSSALQKEKLKHKQLKHYIPCVLFDPSEAEEFSIGPVRFVVTRKFLAENKSGFDSVQSSYEASFTELTKSENQASDHMFHLSTSTPQEMAQRVSNTLTNFKKYCSSYSWIAEVTVPACHSEMSSKRAHLTIEGALNILRLIFAERPGCKFRQAHLPGAEYDVTFLTQNESGSFNFLSNYTFPNESAKSGWYASISNGNYKKPVNVAGSSLNSYLDPSNSNHLHERLLDSLSLYGQAVSETIPSSQIVKLVAALERLVITEHIGELQAAVIKRTTCLFSGLAPECLASKQDIRNYVESWNSTRDVVSRVYNFRCNLMHGKISHNHHELLEVSFEAFYITRQTIDNALLLFSDLADDGLLMPNDLETRYEQMTTHFKALTQKLSSARRD